eukprot:GFUD01016475.1.p1 GENE.GFUD01016475.1~~GFUD01016475.1.p1  ORF type:complete len:310 (+),score=115.92 GFUD01016475.1:41-931(+)
MDSEKEVLLPDSVPSSPTGQPSLPQDPSLPLPSPQADQFCPAHTTPFIETQQPTPELVTKTPGHSRNENKDRREPQLESDRLESRHHSLSHSLPGASHSLPHSGSRHSLASRGVSSHHQATKDKRKEARRQKSAQLPAHGEVQKMEHSLLKLLNEFNSGQLRAFDSAYSLEQMESVRDQQETIARRHFELGAEQDLHPPLSDEGLAMASENMSQLMGSLEQLSQAIGQLSCLDRMVERGVRREGVEDVREGSQMSCSQSDGPLRISRRSTMSDRTDSTQLPDSEDYLDRVSQRTLV